jgi:hypothetical protein
VIRTWPTRTQRASGPSTANSRVPKRGFTRGGNTVCGVLGFQQHLGLWPALLGGVGWLVASDHAGYLLRRRYGAQMRARLSRWQPKGPAHRQLLASLDMLAGHPRRASFTLRTYAHSFDEAMSAVATTLANLFEAGNRSPCDTVTRASQKG